VARGHAEAAAVKSATADKVKAESWWDWAIDTWQGFVQWFAANLVDIWERVNGIVAGLFDQAIQLATRVVNGAVGFVKEAISAYYDLWISLADKLLGNIFPELAVAFRAAIEGLKAAVFEALDAVAAGYLQALRVVADALVAGLDAGVQAYKTGVAAYLALWEAIQQGQWEEIGRTVLIAILTAAGIDPEEFFTTFSKFDEVVDDVIADPGVVGRNAVKALGLGFQQFGTHFIGNFTAAFVEWITGAAAIMLPKVFSLAGIFDVVCHILNLTKPYLHQKAVQHLGQGAVTAIEELTEAAWTFVSGGWAGLWNLVKDKLTTLVDDVVVAISTWLVEKAILVVGRWIVGLAATMGISVIFEALVALWQFVMWLKDQFQRFWMIVKSTVDSVHEFVKGKIQPAADKIEGTLQDLIVPAIDLVAKLLNISNIAKKVEHIIEAVRGLIDNAVDSVINWLKKKLKSAVRKAKAKATEVAGRLVNWWNAKSEFKDKSGESHVLFYKGTRGSAGLYVASHEPTLMTTFLKKKKAKKVTDSNLENATKQYNDIQALEKQLKEPSISDSKRQTLADELQGKLSVFGRGPLASLFKSTIEEFPPPILPVMVAGAKAKGFTADYLCTHPDSKEKKVGPGTKHEGTVPKSDPPGYGNLRNANEKGTGGTWNVNRTSGEHSTLTVGGQRDWYLRLHLLTERLGGKGLDSNLTPALKSINDRFTRVELAADQTAKETPIWYSFQIDYHNSGDKPTNWNPEYVGSDYPSRLLMRWGTYEENAEGVVRRNTEDGKIDESGLRLPGFEETSANEAEAAKAAGTADQYANFVEDVARALLKLGSDSGEAPAKVRELAQEAHKFRKAIRESPEAEADLRALAEQQAKMAMEQTAQFVKEVGEAIERKGLSLSEVATQLMESFTERNRELRKRLGEMDSVLLPTLDEMSETTQILHTALRGKVEDSTVLQDFSTYRSRNRFAIASEARRELRSALSQYSQERTLQERLNAVFAAVKPEADAAGQLEAPVGSVNELLRQIDGDIAAWESQIADHEQVIRTYKAALDLYREHYDEEFSPQSPKLEAVRQAAEKQRQKKAAKIAPVN